MKERDYKYESDVCNSALYGCLVNIKASGVPEEDIPVMLRCMGETLLKMSMLDEPINYYIKHVEGWFMKGGKQ